MQVSVFLLFFLFFFNFIVPFGSRAPVHLLKSDINRFCRKRFVVDFVYNLDYKAKFQGFV